MLWDASIADRSTEELPAARLAPHCIHAACAVQVAVMSAREHSPNLLPVLLYPGKRETWLTEWLAAHGGLAFHHRSVLLPRWKVCQRLSPRVYTLSHLTWSALLEP